jgi:hypothetical protein
MLTSGIHLCNVTPIIRRSYNQKELYSQVGTIQMK